MTNSTASAGGVGPFETRFQTGAAVVSALCVLTGLFVAWSGYQGTALLGTELNMIAGVAGFMLAALFGSVALVAAFYMEPGFGR